MAGRLLSGLLDLLFPPRCAGCGAPGTWFCATCARRVQRIEPPICPRCGESLLPDGRCPRRGRHLELDGVRSVAWHSGPLRVAIHRLKYRGRAVLAAPLGALLVEAWRRDPPPVDLLLPVPLHPRRERERGFNQATLLARELSRSTTLPLNERSLQRVRYTAPQVKLNAGERIENVRGAFEYRGPSLQGQAVCLIDDICTTGATLQACAGPLRRAGARAVWAFTLARPHWGTGDAV